MKNHFMLLFFATVFSVATCFGQSQKYTSFKDYFIVNTNPDSLEKVVYAHKNDPVRYLNELIWLEYSRHGVSDHFGNDLATIAKLVVPQPHKLQAAMYNYLMGYRYNKENFPKSLQYFQKALSYFEATRDTCGMAYCNFTLMRLNISYFNESMGDTKLAKSHYDTMLSLFNSTKDERLKIGLLPGCLFYKRNFYKARPFSEVIDDYKNGLILTQKHPEMAYTLKNFYFSLGLFYDGNGNSKKAIECYQLVLKHSKHSSEYSLIPIYNNLATVYYVELHDVREAEKYLNKILHTVAKPTIPMSEQNYIEAHYNMAFINIENKKFDRIIPYLNTYDSLRKAYNKRLKVSELLDLQTKYETEKKEVENKLLQQKNQTALAQADFFKNGLIFGLITLVIISILAYSLYTSNAKQKQLLAFRDQLFAIIAHDMRSPLTAFHGMSEQVAYLLRKKEYQNIHVLSQSMDEAISNTNLLLSNLLEWALVQNPNLSLNKTSLSVYELAKDTQELYEEVAHSSRATIEITVPESLRIEADRNAMLLILRNLIDNALKHGNSSQVRIQATSEKKFTVIEVSNNGTAIAADKLHILQQQLKKGAAFVQNRSGLGLYLVSYFVGKHQGSITIDSSDENGTKFSVRIPITH